MIETVQASPEREPASRTRRARLDAEALALLNLPSGTPAGQLPLRSIQIEHRGERLRRRDDQHRALTSEVMSRPRSSDLARAEAEREAPQTDPARETRSKPSTAREQLERPSAGFRRELADARREAARPTVAAPGTQSGTPEPGAAREAPGTAAATPAAARTTATATARAVVETGVLRGQPPPPVRTASAGAAALPAAQRVAVATALRPAGAAPSTTAIKPVAEIPAPRTSGAASGGAPTARSERAAAKTPAAPPGEAPSAERSDDANLERVLRVLRMQLARDRASATIRLDPAELGQIRVKLELAGSQLTLDVEAERDAARRLLAEQVDALRRGLEAAGIALERIEVRVVDPATRGETSSGSSGGASWQTGPNDQGPARRDDAPPGGSASQAAAETLEPARPEPIPAAESLVNILA